MRVSIRSFREKSSAIGRNHTGIPVVCDQQHTEPRAHCTSSIRISSGANIRNNWSACGIRSIALPYTTRRVLVLQYCFSLTTSECVTVKRCRYHAIRGCVVCTWCLSYEYGRYRTLHIYGTAVLVPKDPRFL